MVIIKQKALLVSV